MSANTETTVKAVQLSVDQALKAAAAYAGILAPQILPFLVAGLAVNQVAPEVIVTISRWIGGVPPTEAEKAEVAAKLAALNRPETI